jgi:hypothetical protein
VIENCTVNGNVTAASSNGAGVAGNSAITGTGRIEIHGTFFNGEFVHSGVTTNIFIGSAHTNLIIEDSGYYIKGALDPIDANISIDGLLIDESLIERVTNGGSNGSEPNSEFIMLVPVGKISGGAVVNNTISTISFWKDGYILENIVISENNARMRYNFDLGIIILNTSGADVRGDGTEDSPFLITDADELLYVSSMIEVGGSINGVPTVSAHYRLGQHIDLSASENFFGIGTQTHNFQGTFDGGGFRIRLNISSATESNVGLFRFTDGAVIKNLTVDGTIRGVGNVGGIVGNASNGTLIESAVNSAAIFATAANSGGIVGNAQSVHIERSRNTANISGAASTGGIAGLVNHTVITSSASIGNVTGTTNVGGIAGLTENGSLITDCRTERTARVFGGQYIGGISGRLITSTITDSTSNSPVTGTAANSYTGGISGSSENSTIRNSAGSGNIAGTSYTGGITGNFISTNAATPGLIEGCKATGTVTAALGADNRSAGIVGVSGISGTGRLTIRSTYFTGGELINSRVTNIFIGTAHTNLVIENSGYEIRGSLVPANAAVEIDGVLWNESLINRGAVDGNVPRGAVNGDIPRNAVGELTITVPISKTTSTTAVPNNSPERIKFSIGEQSQERFISRNNAKTDYILNLGRIIIVEPEDWLDEDKAEIENIIKPNFARFQSDIRLITATVENEIESVEIDIEPYGGGTWALYSNAACTIEIEPSLINGTSARIMNLSAGANTAYIKVTSANGENSRIYTVTITRELVRPNIVTGLRAVFREFEVLLQWDIAFEANVTGYNIYRSSSPNSGFLRLTTIDGRNNTSFTDRTILPNREYYYRVSAVDSFGAESFMSPAVLGMAHSDIYPPEIISITPANGATVGRNTGITIIAADNISV